MKLEVLVSTMHQNNHDLLERMNISTDAVIINQCEKNLFEELEYKGKRIRFISLAERGVGLSRNNALMRAQGDICLFSDEDVVYADNYENIIKKAFVNNPEADMVMFNVLSINEDRPTYVIPSKFKVGIFNCLRFGAINIAVKTERVKQANIFFSLLFGGGAKYSSGEDTLFVIECMKKGLKIVAVPDVIGSVKQDHSTWFDGYTDKYFIDKGVLFTCISKFWAYPLCIQFAIRRRRLFKQEKTVLEACRLMFLGVNSVK